MTHDWPKAIAHGWHPIAYTKEISRRPFAAQLMGHSLVVFRTLTGFAVLQDRCPHRNAPLSRGRVVNGAIACPYHGWTFGGDGRCMAVPGASACPKIAARRFPAIERAGLIWTSLADDPDQFPALPPAIEDDALDTFWWTLPASTARVLDAIENLLDPAHPHFLHPWLVRSPDQRKRVTASLIFGAWGGEARYTEDGPPPWLPRLFERERQQSIGRFFTPTMGEVAFEGARGMTIAITVIFAPEAENRTRPYAHFATPRGAVPAWFKRLAIIAFHKPVLAQDRRALRMQSDTIDLFGGPAFSAGPLDVFGPLIWRLANGEAHIDGRRDFEMML